VGNGFKIRPSREISVAEHFGISLDDEFGNTKQQESKTIHIFFNFCETGFDFFFQ
jgi:hypothetical protein